MTTAQYISGFLALAVLLWPQLPAIWAWIKSQDVGGSKPPPSSYRDAIVYLAFVRNRLVATGALGEDQKRAIDVLTLALVDGSDK
jgi:hypothetical protein